MPGNPIGGIIEYRTK